MKKVLFGLLIAVLVFSGLSCFANEVADYAGLQNLPPEVVETLVPLGEEGMDMNERGLVDETSILPQEIQVSETVLNLLKEIVQDTVVTNEKLDRFKDLDQDGLSNQEELKQGTDLLNGDTDRDGLWDGEELLVYQTDPLNSDSDEDSLSDGREVLTYGTMPLNRDTDDDSLRDNIEVVICGTNPLKEDSDSDGFTDPEELLVLESDPLDKDNPFALIKEREDSDGDGVKDCDDPEPFEPNTYKETVSWLSEEMREDALSCIDETDKVQTFRNLQKKVFENVFHVVLTQGKYPNAKWDNSSDWYQHPRDILMDYYSYYQKVQLPPDCDDAACVYDIMADYIIAQTGWDEEGESQGNNGNGVDCDVFPCLWKGLYHNMCIINIEGVEYVADPSGYQRFFKLGTNRNYLFPWDEGWNWPRPGGNVLRGSILMVKFDKRYTDSIYNKRCKTLDVEPGSFWEMMRNQTPENEKELKELYLKVRPVY